MIFILSGDARALEWFLIAGEHPAGEVAEIGEQAQASQPLGKVAGLPGVGVVASAHRPRRGVRHERLAQAGDRGHSLEGRGFVRIDCRARGEWFGVGQWWWLRVVDMAAGGYPGGTAVGVVGD